MGKKFSGLFSLVKENPVFDGCTVSSKVREDGNLTALCFSMGKGTSISDEMYRFPNLYIVLSGFLKICTKEAQHELKTGDSFIVSKDLAHSVEAVSDCVFVQIGLKGDIMNSAKDIEGVFQLKDLVPYQEGKIVNRDLISGDGTRLSVIALSKGTSLPEHAAPSDALLFALDGEAVFTHKGKPYTLKAGDNFSMSCGDRHKLDTVTDFKFALLLTRSDEE